MKKTLSAVAVACTLATLAGCSNPPAIFAPDPIIIEHEKTLDRVHNRDVSMEFYDKSRGGAAVRQDKAAHVLWNEHYVADAKALADKAEAQRLAEVAKAEEEARQAALKKAEEDKKAKALLNKNGKSTNKANQKNAKDKSIYGKDKSIYKDRSVYKDSSVYANKHKVTKKEVKPASATTTDKEKKITNVKTQELAKIKQAIKETSAKPESKFQPKSHVVDKLKLAPMPENPKPVASNPNDPCCSVNQNATPAKVPSTAAFPDSFHEKQKQVKLEQATKIEKSQAATSATSTNSK